MWITDKVLDIFTVNVELINRLRTEVEVLKTERDGLKVQALVNQNHFDWLRQRVNVLEAERAQYLEKLYGIKVPVPEIVRQADPRSVLQLTSDLFNDVGDDNAKNLGLQ